MGSDAEKSRQEAQHLEQEHLHRRLAARREEIEKALLVRIYRIDEPMPVDLAYVDGLRAAASAALDYSLAALAESDGCSPPIPAQVVSQARLAARKGVLLDAVLRRYTAGYGVLVDFLIEELEKVSPCPSTILRRLLADAASTLDRFLSRVSEEYAREVDSRKGSSWKRRHVELIDRLLAGEPVDVAEVSYDFQRRHLAICVQGTLAEERAREAAAGFQCSKLIVPREDDLVWAWFGFQDAPKLSELVAYIDLAPEEVVAVGEFADGLAGWRLTHQQAVAALPIAQRRAHPIVHYMDVLMLTAVLENELALTSIHQSYVKPLSGERDGGRTLRRTLQAYFATERNVSSAAALLGVTRRTVSNRLRVVESRLGGPVDACAAALQTALQIADLDSPEMVQPVVAPTRPVRKMRS